MDKYVEYMRVMMGPLYLAPGYQGPSGDVSTLPPGTSAPVPGASDYKGLAKNKGNNF